MVSGYFRVADAVLMRVMDALMAFPAILLALAVMAIAGPATINVVLALGIAYSPRMARLARAAVLTVRTRDFIEAALSFVGLGTPPPAPSLGNILADARPVLRDAPWMIVFPSLMLSVTILGLNLFGDGIRDVLDPRMRI